MSVYHTLGAHGDRKRALDSQNLITDVCQPPDECWERKPGALQEQQVFSLLSHLVRFQIDLSFKKFTDGA